jgi:SPP1 gp7 family putative phage head morphogenesis protein
MITQAIMQPILSADWYIETENEQLKHELETELGLETDEDRAFPSVIFPTWQFYLRQCLISVRHGFVLLEKVRDFVDGKYIHRRLATRLPATVDKWIVKESEFKKLFPDKDLPLDTFLAIEQAGYEGDQYKNGVYIPRDKLVHISLFQEGQDYEGFSLYRGVYQHWKIKNALYKFDVMRHERIAMPVPVAKHNNTLSSEQLNDVANFLKNIRVNQSAFGLMPDGITEITLLESKTSNDSMLATIEHHNQMIINAMLLQGMNLGNTKNGSRATAETQMDFFYNFVDSIAKTIAQSLTNDVIQEYRILNNYSEPAELKFSNLQKIDIDTIVAQINESVKSGALTPTPDVENKLRTDYFDLEEIEDSEQEKSQEEKKIEEMQSPFNNQKKFAENYRPLTLAESRVAFDKIERVLDQNEEKLNSSLNGVLESTIALLLVKVKVLLENKDYEGIRQLSLKLIPEVGRQIREIVDDVYNIGIREASKELNVLRAPTPAEAKKFNTLQSEIAKTDLENRLISDTQKELLNAINQGFSPTETVYKVKQRTQSSIDKALTDIGSIVIASALNRGRDYVFTKNVDDIYAYQWSAILDNRICQFCEQMDGKVLDVTDPLVKAAGSVHSNCRCVVVPVRKVQSDKPEITGKPDNIIYNGLNDFKILPSRTIPLKEKSNPIKLTEEIKKQAKEKLNKKIKDTAETQVVEALTEVLNAD